MPHATRRLTAGLSACGGIAPLTLDAARASPDFEIVAIQDPDLTALDRVGDEHGIENRFEDFEDLADFEPDFLILNSPNDRHLPQVRIAAESGIHCLVQKPLAPRLADGEEIVRRAADAGMRLGVTMFELGKPLNHQVRMMVRSGWLGDPVLVQATAAHTIYMKEPPAEDDWRRDPAKVGGAAFIQLAIHHLGLAAWLLDQEIRAICATGTKGHTVFEDETTLATVRFDGGILAHFAASYATDLAGLTLCGTRGRVHLLPEHVVVRGEEEFEGDIFNYEEPGREVSIPLETLAPVIADRAAAVEIHGAFARWIRDGEEYPCPAERGLADLRAVDAAYRSMKEEGWIEL